MKAKKNWTIVSGFDRGRLYVTDFDAAERGVGRRAFSRRPDKAVRMTPQMARARAKRLHDCRAVRLAG